MQLGYENCIYQPIPRFISETIQDRAIVTVECQYELIRERDLSYDAIFNDLE